VKPIVKAKGLVKIYGKDIRAVDNIDFEIMEGEVFGFLGPNGAGKSTTISMITTLLTPTEGHITVDGLDTVKDSYKVRKLIGLVPQDLTADDELSGRENLFLQADLYDVPRPVARERIEELLKLMNLEDAADRRVDTYSGGMRKRLELAEGLIHRPRILFLDEPTLGLDIQTREVIWNHIQKLKKESGMTVFLTTHYLEEADALCDRIAIIDEGRIKVLGTPSELKSSLGGDKISMDIVGEEDHTESLALIPGVDSVERSGQTYLLRTADGDAAMGEVLMRIGTEEGWKVRSITVHKPSLNQVFLEYTGKSLRDDQQSGASNRHAARTATIQNQRRR